jgi:hypothetical protein
VIVFGSSFSEHIQRLETVLQRILDAGLKLKPEKCTILKPEVTFLICRTSETFLGAGQDNILAILSGFGFIPFCETTCPRKVTSGFSIVHFSGFSFKSQMNLYGPMSVRKPLRS